MNWWTNRNIQHIAYNQIIAKFSGIMQVIVVNVLVQLIQLKRFDNNADWREKRQFFFQVLNTQIYYLLILGSITKFHRTHVLSQFY